MKIAAHITYFHSTERMPYFNKVVESLQNIDPKPDIFIYTNRHLADYSNLSNVDIKKYSYKRWLLPRIIKNYSIGKFLPRFMIHPFLLAWENRKWVEKSVDEYDIQIYLEDDIHFQQDNLDYWLKYKKLTLPNDYNLGFLRIEKDHEGKELMTDVNWPLDNIIEIEGQKFLINNLNPYCGFWIYDKIELKNFIKSKEWKFKFEGYGIRAKAAVGWHGKEMDRYKETIIPLVENNGKLITPSGAAVHHLPNNYIGKGRYCTKEFPIELN
ncbi:hypothetical protein ACNI3T_10925 [Christiangramia sp. ASW11-125]|uniref:hypothetical protein n=1 Tax=Christiangramia sp. ASW11-125 TaxID=3400701 RepID=UPI003AAC3AE2